MRSIICTALAATALLLSCSVLDAIVLVQNAADADLSASNSEYAVGIDANAFGASYLIPTSWNGDESPGLADRVATLTFSFAETGNYDLWVRYYLGSSTDLAPDGRAGAQTQDSFYVANGFGSQNVSDDSAWLKINSLPGSLYSEAVYPQSTYPANTYRWLNVRAFGASEPSSEAPVAGTYAVAVAGEYTLQFAARESGVRIDAVAFYSAADSPNVIVADNLDGTTVPELSTAMLWVGLVATGVLAARRRGM